MWTESVCLLQRLQPEDAGEDVPQNAVVAVVVGSVLEGAVRAVLISTAETLTEVIVVGAFVAVVTVIPVVSVLVLERVLIAAPIPVLLVSQSHAISLIIAGIDRAIDHVRSVLVDLIVGAAAVIPVGRRAIEVRIVLVVIRTLQSLLLLTLVCEIVLFVLVVGVAVRLLELCPVTLRGGLLLVQPLLILRDPLLLLRDQLALAFFRKALLLAVCGRVSLVRLR